LRKGGREGAYRYGHTRHITPPPRRKVLEAYGMESPGEFVQGVGTCRNVEDSITVAIPTTKQIVCQILDTLGALSQNPLML
jgi:hypothetical protein